MKNYNAEKEDVARKTVTAKKKMLVPEFEDDYQEMDGEAPSAKKIIKTE